MVYYYTPIFVACLTCLCLRVFYVLRITKSVNVSVTNLAIRWGNYSNLICVACLTYSSQSFCVLPNLSPFLLQTWILGKVIISTLFLLSFNTLLMIATAMCIPIKQREFVIHAMIQESILQSTGRNTKRNNIFTLRIRISEILPWDRKSFIL